MNGDAFLSKQRRSNFYIWQLSLFLVLSRNIKILGRWQKLKEMFLLSPWCLILISFVVRFREEILPQQFNILVTTYEFLMSKHDRPKLAKIPWHYIIIDEGHRIKNASCKLNAELKQYQSTHRLLLTGTPIQVRLTWILATHLENYILLILY